MGWKGTLRSIQAASRRADKERQRIKKHREKALQIQAAENTLNKSENYIKYVTNLHVKCDSQKVDWEAISKKNPPLEPKRLDTYESKAQYKYNNYKPSIIDKVFRMGSRRKDRLWNSIEESVKKDEKEYLEKLKLYHDEYSQWEIENKLALGLIEKNPKVYKEAVQKFWPFIKLADVCLAMKTSVYESGELALNLIVKNDDIIPKNKHSLRQSGTLLTKTISKGEHNCLYQDYVCSCVLRIAAELFIILPIERVLINANSDLLNLATGYVEEQTVLSVIIMRKTLVELNLANLEASPAMKNFIHVMDFKKMTGFKPVAPMSIDK